LGENLAVGLGLKFIYSRLASGQTVNGQEITPGTSVAGDLSLTWTKPLKLGGNKANYVLGVAITNLGTKISYTNSVNRDFIPTNLGIGQALELNFDEFNKITFAVDINKLLVPTPDENLIDENPANGVPDYKEVSLIAGVFSSFGDAPGGFTEELNELMYSIGVEYWYDNQFAVRVGHYNEHATKGNRKFFTVGLGLKYSIFGLNFSYLVPTSNQRNPLDNTLRFSLLFDFGAFGDEETPGDL
ncbi:MAG: type IX secretion system outer membrane channel protein PorV, partial [Bacteroidota bacterium]